MNGVVAGVSAVVAVVSLFSTVASLLAALAGITVAPFAFGLSARANRCLLVRPR